MIKVTIPIKKFTDEERREFIEWWEKEHGVKLPGIESSLVQEIEEPEDEKS